MLGKGLESLIPQKGAGGNNDDHNNDNDRDKGRGYPLPSPPSSSLSSSTPNPLLPDGVGQGGTDLRPEHELPARPVAQASASLPTDPAPVTIAPVGSSDVKSQPQPVMKLQSQTSQASPKQQPIKKDELTQESIFQIEVEKIEPNPGQPRRVFNQDALQDMARSIREFGILQPLVVTKIEKETPTGVDISYQLIAGERRLMAAKLLGLRLVPAIVRKVGLEREKLELAIIENIQRENLNPLETARAFQRLQEEFRMTQREIAAKMGKSREVIANTVRLLDLPEYVQEALGLGTLSESHARLLLAVADPGAQKKLFDEIVLNGLTTRDVKERVKAMTARRPYHRHAPTGDLFLGAEVKAMQETLSMSLGAPVEIQKSATTNNGKIMISFYSEEELENILRRLGKEEA